MARKVPLGVLISGEGTNLQAIIDAVEGGRLDAVIRVVVSNDPQAYGLQRAERHSLTRVVLNHQEFPSREAFDEKMVTTLRGYEVELVILAGFNRLLSPPFIRAFPQRIMNIHPALLPSFPGLHAQRQAAQYGVRFSGATVHFVDELCDHGPIIIQAVVPIYPDDTEEDVRLRILKEEHRIFPYAIQLFAEGRLKVKDRRVIIRGLDQEAAGVLINPPLP